MTLSIFGNNPGRVKDAVAAFGEKRYSAGNTTYHDIEFEQLGYREPNNTDKKLFYFNDSLDHLRQRGFERHPRSAEVFSFLADGLEGKLSPQEKEVFDDMLTSYGEWLSTAVQVIQRGSSQILEVYLDPEGLVWDGSKYVQQNFKYADKREYDITNIPLQQYVDLNRFPNTFVVDIYSRPFAELPQEMREGSKRAQAYLPPVGVIRPVGRYNVRFGFNLFGDGASRGVVVVAQKSSTGNEGRKTVIFK